MSKRDASASELISRKDRLLSFEQLMTIFQVLILAFGAIAVVLFQRRNPQHVATAVADEVGKVGEALQTKIADIFQQSERNQASQHQLNQALINRLWAENDSLKASLNSLEETVKAQSLQIRDGELKSQENKRVIEDFVTESQSRAQDVKDLQAQVGEFRKVIEGQQGKIATLESDVSGEKAKIAALESQRDRLQGELEQVRTEADKLKERVGLLEKQHDVDIAEKDQLTAELAKKEQRIQELEAQVKDLESKVSELQAKLDAKEKPSGGPEGSQP